MTLWSLPNDSLPFMSNLFLPASNDIFHTPEAHHYSEIHVRQGTSKYASSLSQIITNILSLCSHTPNPTCMYMYKRLCNRKPTWRNTKLTCACTYYTPKSSMKHASQRIAKMAIIKFMVLLLSCHVVKIVSVYRSLSKSTLQFYSSSKCFTRGCVLQPFLNNLCKSFQLSHILKSSSVILRQLLHSSNLTIVPDFHTSILTSKGSLSIMQIKATTPITFKRIPVFP